MIAIRGLKWRLALLALWSLLALPERPLAASCAPPSDWRNISMLPTNGDAGTNIAITLRADKTQVVPGDKVSVTFQANSDCYLTIMNVGSSGKIIRLWPNSYSGSDNRILAGAPRQFPGPDDGFAYRIAGPTGVERIVAYATSERDKILGEEEFRQLGQTGFKEFRGNSKDLAVIFQNNADRLSPKVKWGSAQINLCIGASPEPGRGPAAESPAASTPAEMTSKIYCLAAGVSLGKLKYCEDDTRKLVDLLKKKFGIHDGHSRILLGPEATHEGFSTGLKWLASVTRPEDTVIVYFNGHGSSLPDQAPLDETDGRDEAFVLYHADEQRLSWREALKKKRLMIDDEFNAFMKRIPARGKIVIADSCHSGTISKDVADDEDLVSKYYPLLDPDTGQELPEVKAKAVPVHYGNDNEACMSACLDNESSYESTRLKSSVFTYYLLKAIKDGSRDLKSAFETARGQTLEYCAKAARKGKHKTLRQTPSLTDPHDLAWLMRFGK